MGTCFLHSGVSFGGRSGSSEKSRYLSPPCKASNLIKRLFPITQVADFECSCLAGYRGRYCEVNVNECDSNPCQNGGVCLDGVARYSCQCPTGISINQSINQSISQSINQSVSQSIDQSIIQSVNQSIIQSVYKPPISKKEGDVQYRLLHKILPSQEVLHYIDRTLPKTCGWCGPSERGTLLHLFFQCPSIQPALNLLHRCLRQLLPELTLTFETYWCLIHHGRGRQREKVDLANYLIVSFKASVYWLYVHSNFKDCLETWKYRIKSKILVEHRYYQLQNNVPLFLKKWDLCNIFQITDNEIEWIL